MTEQAPQIREVGYHPPVGTPTEAEVTDLATLRRRGGAREFTSAQRLAFELFLQVRSGRTTHEVDFTRYVLGPGDLLWVHAGQVQRWGEIEAIDGRVVLFPPTLLDAPTAAQLTRLGALRRNHWPSAATEGTTLDAELGSLEATSSRIQMLATTDQQARVAALAHSVLAALLLVAGVCSGSHAEPLRADHVFSLFEQAIEDRFDVDRSVQAYALTLGYSERTLNRAARATTGLSAKELIDRRVVLEAKRLLAHETRSVAGIAASLGFDDPSNFHKYFTSRVGQAPGAFRAAMRPRLV